MDEIKFDKNQPLFIFSYSVPENLAELHLHNCMELGLVISGSGEFHVDNKIIPYQPGDIFLINRFEAHRAKSFNGPSRWYFLFLSDVLLEMISALSPGRNYYSLFSLAGKHFQNKFTSVIIETVFRKIHDEFWSQNIYKLDLVKAYAAELLILLMRQFQIELSAFQNQVSVDFGASLLAVYDYINEHYTEQIPVSELAEIAHLSESHFRKLFKIYTGKSPIEYIHNRKLKQAYILISEKGMSPLQASYHAGFSSYSFFQKLFKDEFGKTPRAARKNKDRLI